jgi:hypothetical protein
MEVLSSVLGVRNMKMLGFLCVCINSVVEFCIPFVCIFQMCYNTKRPQNISMLEVIMPELLDEASPLLEALVDCLVP